MPSQQGAAKPVVVSAMDAIYHRRAVRDFTSQKIDKATISILIDAAIHAPTAMHEEAWVFAIVQDKAMLNRLSDKVKELLSQGSDLTSQAINRAGSARGRLVFHKSYWYEVACDYQPIWRIRSRMSAL